MYKLLCCIVGLLLFMPYHVVSAGCGDEYGCCDQLGSPFEGVAAYHNGYYHNCTHGCWSCAGNGPYGGQYQCVEYVRRFYALADEVKTDHDNWTGDAGAYFNSHQVGLRGLVRYQNDFTAHPPQPHDILCFDNGGIGHVAIVTAVTFNYDDGDTKHYTVSIIEQNWGDGHEDLPMVKTSAQSGMGHYFMSQRCGNSCYAIQGWLRFPWDLIETEYNSNGGSSAFGTLYLQFTTTGTNYVHFYHGGQVSNTTEDADCVIHNFSSGSYGNCGIVFDAYGGAKRAYTVRTGFWNDGNEHGWAYLDGPTSLLGMPITNEYTTSYGARQDFRNRFLKYENGSVSTPQVYPHAAPGWHENNNWDEGFSYLFAMAYERNGAWNVLGDATEPVDLNWRGTAYHAQHFGSDDKMIVYDPFNKVDNNLSTDEAYYLSGNFYTVYTASDGAGPWLLGAPTTDRSGNVQYFKYGRMEEVTGGAVRAYNLLNECKWGCDDVSAVGGPGPFYTGIAFDFDGDDIADYWDRTSTGELHFDYAINNLTDWDTTFYGYGGSQDNPAPADYDGDGKYDFAILKNANSKWYIDYAANGFGGWDDSLGGYGTAADYPCPGDYDGDGVADIAVRDADGDWHIDYFALGNGFGAWDVTYQGYGGQYDRPCPADFNGDGMCDFAILRDSDRKWLIDYAHNGFGSWDVTNLGGYGGFADYPCPSDYDNDGSDDIAVLNTTDRVLRVDRTGNGFTGWDYVLGGYGGSGDRPMPADYDGDGWDDIATYYAAYDQICLDYASDNYGEWDWCDDGPDHPTWKVGVPLEEEGIMLPTEFSVSQNYPNPFNPVTTFSYALPTATHVRLDIYNVLGLKVITLVDGQQPAGRYTIRWDGHDCASGIYFYRLVTDQATETKKMILLK